MSAWHFPTSSHGCVSLLWGAPLLHGEGGKKQNISGPPGPVGLVGQWLCPLHAHHQGGDEAGRSNLPSGRVQKPW